MSKSCTAAMRFARTLDREIFGIQQAMLSNNELLIFDRSITTVNMVFYAK